MARQLTSPVVIATHNPGKLAEMRELLAPYGIEAQSAGELGLAEPRETGKSFAANARIKALAAAKAAGRAAFADDSGLVVDALNGEPGIHSSRWAGPDKDFRGAMNRIQTLLIERGARAAGTAALRISSPRCVSPGRTAMWRNSRAASMASSPGRRAAFQGFRLRSAVFAGWFHTYLRRDERAGKARAAAARPRPVAPRARVPQAGGGVLAQRAIITILNTCPQQKRIRSGFV